MVFPSASILIFTDREQDQLRAWLAAVSDTRITKASTVELVEIILESSTVDLLVVDITAPAFRSGLISSIRARLTEAQLPILIVSHSFEDAAATLHEGATDYIAQHARETEFAVRVKSLLTIRMAYKRQLKGEMSSNAYAEHRNAQLNMLIKNGIMMSLEHDREKLLEFILVEGKQLLNCDAATIYLRTEQDTLRFGMRTKNDDLPALELPIYEHGTLVPNEKFVSTYVAAHNKAVVIDDVYLEARFDLSGTRLFDEKSGYKTVSMLTVPLAPRRENVVGVLQFINAIDKTTGEVVSFSEDQLPLVEALAAQAAVALDNMQLIEAQKDLLDNMIQVIASTLDAKSPHTGRHCSRVPELAMMLTEAANDAKTGPLAEFCFSTEEEWREFKIGAWLHDCGKVTTPEHVIDKATKLESLYNRIHEVRTRFEVLLRDAEIERLQAIACGEPVEVAAEQFEKSKTLLFKDFAFVAECNLACQPMSPERIERLREVSKRTWLRHFDDGLGLSEAELLRHNASLQSTLPAVERLLADKASHEVVREEWDVPDPSYGFKMDIPANLYNHGEIYNLSIPYGTLTEEERYKINEHMVYTIVMLEKMKFPKHLQRVPEYAGTHHEGLHGNGYPRRLSEKDLSIPSRIMAIADIFEALTAADRPYKKPNKVSEAIQILYGMKKRRHIDADLFDLFLTSGTYLRYAEQFVQKELIDDVEIAQFLG